jgi:putative ABC transport system permease protein
LIHYSPSATNDAKNDSITKSGNSKTKRQEVEMIHYLRALAARLRGLFGGRRADRDLDDEIETHLRLLTERYVRQGMSEDEAAWAARRQFGNVTLLKEDHREMRGIRFIEALVQDLKYGLRMLRKNPGFTFVAVLTLALGIGANTAIFSVVNAVLIRSLPFSEADRLVTIWETHPDIPQVGPAFPDFEDWRAQSQSFQEMEVYSFRRYGNALLTGHAEPVQVHGALTSARFFAMLSARPIIGRVFLPEEEKRGADQVVILSRSLWLRHFAGAKDVIGKSIQLNGNSFTIVGVIGEQYPPEIDCWLPLSQMDGDDFTNRMNRSISVIGRLNPGVTIDHARREMQAIAERLQQLYPASNKMEGVELTPMRNQMVGNLRTIIWLIFAAFALILLIACANVSNLILARSAERQREMALRATLGAGRGRLVRQLLIESLMLAGLGGIAGLMLARWTIPALRSSLLSVVTGKVPGLETIGVEWHTLAFTFGISLLTGALFGVIPALLVSRADLNQVLKDGGKTAIGGMRRNLSQVLVIAEVALAVVVLAGSGLLVRSLQKLLHVDPGFRADRLLSLKIELPLPQYQKDEQIMGFYRRLMPQLLALPGVQQAAVIDRLPFAASLAVSRFVPEDKPIEPGKERIAQFRAVDHRFFEMMRIPLRNGRLFKEADIGVDDTLHFGRIIINESMARNFFPDRDPIGKRLRSDWGAIFSIIGVVGDIKDLGLDAPVEPEIYFPGVARDSLLLVRTTVAPSTLASAVQQAVISNDPIQPRYEARTVEELLSTSLARRRFSVALLAISASLALILAAIGIYGVIAYSVTQRVNEIGVRMALGAQSHDVIKLIISQGMKPTLGGIVIGVSSALALTRWMKGFLFGVSATDPMTFATIALLLSAVALLACWIPARRAAKVDPLQALRHD